MKLKYFTKSADQTRKLGEELALEFAGAVAVFGLQGDLGSGKTTFLQGFAKGLGIKEKVLSPTFVILKHFKITKPKVQIKSKSNPKSKIINSKFTNFYHIDCYRISKPEEVLELGFKKIISDPKNIVAVEWPEKIKNILPESLIKIEFKFIDENTREITPQNNLAK